MKTRREGASQHLNLEYRRIQFVAINNEILENCAAFHVIINTEGELSYDSIASRN